MFDLMKDPSFSLASQNLKFEEHSNVQVTSQVSQSAAVKLFCSAADWFAPSQRFTFHDMSARGVWFMEEQRGRERGRENLCLKDLDHWDFNFQMHLTKRWKCRHMSHRSAYFVDIVVSFVLLFNFTCLQYEIWPSVLIVCTLMKHITKEG